MSMERRRHRRFAVQLPAEFRGEHLDGEGVVADVSERGCAIACHPLPEVGASLALEILIPDHYTPVGVERVRVRWAVRGKFGVEFDVMGSKEEVRLRRIVRGRADGWSS